jgi:TP901 family phage tail tape measure protein
MPVGLGGGINLGSATMYIFADATGLTRGLRQAEREVSASQARMARLNKQIQIAELARKRSEDFKPARDLVDSPAFAARQASLAKAFQDASKDISQAYADRTKASNAHAKVERDNNNAIKRYQRDLVENRATVRRNAERMKVINLDLGDPAIKKGAAAKLKKELDDLENAQDDLLRKRVATTDLLTKKRLSADAKMKASATTTAAAFKTANDVEIKAVRDVGHEMQRQNAQFRQIANIGGPAYHKLADDIEAAGRKQIASMRAVARAQSELSKANLAVGRAETSGQGVNQALAARQQAVVALAAAEDQMAKATARRSQLSGQMTAKVIADDNARIASAQKEAAIRDGLQAQDDAQNRVARLQKLDRIAAGATVATAILGAAAGASAAQFGTFEEAMRRAMSVSEELRPRLEDAMAAIQDLSVEFGKAPAEIAAGFESIAQAGITDFDDAMKLTAVGTKAAAAGATDVETAVKPLIGLMNAYGLTAEEAAEKMDVLFKGVTDGVFRFEDLASQLGDNLSIASQLQIPIEELTAAYVVLTKRSNNLSESTTQVNAVMNSFLKPSAALNKQIKEMTGLTAQAFIRTASFGDVLKVVGDAFRENADAAAQLFPNIRAIRGVFALSADEAAAFTDELNALREAGGSMDEVFDFQAEGFAFQMRQIREEFRELGISIGEAAAPKILQFFNVLREGASFLNNFNTAMGGLPGRMLVYGATAAGATAVTLRLFAAYSSTIGAITRFGAALRGGQTVLLGMTRTSALLGAVLSGPVVLGLIAAAAAAAILWERHQREKEAVKELQRSYQELEATISKLNTREDLTGDEAKALNDLAFNIKWLNGYTQQLEQNLNRIDGSFVKIDQSANRNEETAYRWATAMDAAGNATDWVSGSAADFQAYQQQLALTNEEMKPLLDNLNTIISDSNLDVSKVSREIDPIIRGILNGTHGMEDLAAQILHVKDNLHLYQEQALVAGNATVTLGSSLINARQFYGTVEGAADKLREGLKALTDQSLQSAGAFDNFDSPLAFIQQRLGNVGERVRRLALMGNIRGMTADQFVGVDALARLEKAKRDLAGVEEQMRSSQGAISEWNQRISSVEDAIGTSADGYAQLNTLLDAGKISQQEYNEIVSASNYLHRQAAVSIQEEQVALARSVVDLAAFVKQHEFLQGQYDQLTPEQKGFAEALKDTGNQMILLTAIMLEFAHAMDPDAFSREMVDGFYQMLVKTNPEAAALLDSVGLLSDEFKDGLNIDGVQDLPESFEAANDELKRLRDERKKVIEDFEKNQRFNRNEGGPSSTGMAAEAQADIAALDEQIGNLERHIAGMATDLDLTDGVAQAAQTIESQLLPQLQEVDETTKRINESWDEAFTPMSDDVEEVNSSMANMVNETLDGLNKLSKTDDPLAFLNESVGRTGESLEGLLLILDRLEDESGIELSLTAEQKTALEWVEAMRKVDRELESVAEEMQNNDQDMSMWQGRIDAVNSAFGITEERMDELDQLYQSGAITQGEYYAAVAAGSDELASLDDLLAEGRITQKEYDAALESGLWIRERSTGALRDEQAEQVKLLPALQGLIEKHDTLDASYDDLTESQKEFIAGLSNQAAQMALMQLLMLAQLEALGLVAEGTSAMFAETAGAADEAIGAIFRELGILDAGGNATFNVQVKSDYSLFVTPEQYLANQRRIAIKLTAEYGDDPEPPPGAGLDSGVGGGNIGLKRNLAVDFNPTDIKNALRKSLRITDDTSIPIKVEEDPAHGTDQVVEESKAKLDLWKPKVPVVTTEHPSDNASKVVSEIENYATESDADVEIEVKEDPEKSADSVVADIEAAAREAAPVVQIGAARRENAGTPQRGSGSDAPPTPEAPTAPQGGTVTFTTKIDMQPIYDQLTNFTANIAPQYGQVAADAFALAFGNALAAGQAVIAANGLTPIATGFNLWGTEVLGLSATNAGNGYVANLVNALVIGTGSVQAAVNSYDTIFSLAGSAWGGYGSSAGAAFAQGAANGVNSNAGLAAQAAAAMGDQMKQALNNALGVESPSKASAETAYNFVLGATIALHKKKYLAAQESASMGSDIVDAFTAEVSALEAGRAMPGGISAFNDSTFRTVDGVAVNSTPSGAGIGSVTINALTPEDLLELIQGSRAGKSAEGFINSLKPTHGKVMGAL